MRRIAFFSYFISLPPAIQKDAPDICPFLVSTTPLTCCSIVPVIHLTRHKILFCGGASSISLPRLSISGFVNWQHVEASRIVDKSNQMLDLMAERLPREKKLKGMTVLIFCPRTLVIN